MTDLWFDVGLSIQLHDCKYSVLLKENVCREICIVYVLFLNAEGGSQKATLVVLVVVISSLKIPKAFLIRSGAQRNFAHTFMLTLPTDLPSQIFHLFSN